jgi:HPt (histidine-containing phosphotransfer) domain-containing protein
MDDPEARQIVRQFVVELEGQLEGMRHAWAERDLETLARLAHSLRGAGGTLGFAEFTAPTTALEQLARNRQEGNAEAIIAELASLAGRIVVPSEAGPSRPEGATAARGIPDSPTEAAARSVEPPAQATSPATGDAAVTRDTSKLGPAPNRPPLVSSLPTSDPEFRAIVEGFVVRLNEQVVAMKSSWQAGDNQELARLVHWLKGAGGTVGFAPLSEVAKNLEQVAKQNERDEIEKTLAELIEMVDSIEIPPADTAAHPAIH